LVPRLYIRGDDDNDNDYSEEKIDLKTDDDVNDFMNEFHPRLIERFYEEQQSRNQIINCAILNSQYYTPDNLENPSDARNKIPKLMRFLHPRDQTEEEEEKNKKESVKDKCYEILKYQKGDFDDLNDDYIAVCCCLGERVVNGILRVEPSNSSSSSSSSAATATAAASKKRKSMEPPDAFMCPITYDIMVDPVVATDGNSYERAAIAQWFASGKTTSPITREPMQNTLIQNRNLKKLIEEWQAENGGQNAGKRRRRTIKKRKGIVRRTKRSRTASRR
jgi:hypothetical protein